MQLKIMGKTTSRKAVLTDEASYRGREMSPGTIFFIVKSFNSEDWLNSTRMTMCLVVHRFPAVQSGLSPNKQKQMKDGTGNTVPATSN